MPGLQLLALAALVFAVNPLIAQNAAHVVIVDGHPALRFSSSAGTGDVLVRRTVAGNQPVLEFDVVAQLMKGKGTIGGYCGGVLKVSRESVTFAYEQQRVPGGCRQMVALNARPAAMESLKVDQYPQFTALKFTSGATMYSVILKADGRRDSEAFCRQCDLVAYEFLSLALAVPDDAFARFDALVASSAVPKSTLRN